ncbi:MAG TPA: RNA 2',3'-cyclic phosphodiesterase [Acidobacteriaceae bacterium]|nr:RNA 2',3'-cyclic phosphodiesterase [Acidobacteriaceae bacterium]
MRLFLGIPLPPDTSGQLSRISLRYQSPSDNLRWYPPESWHITLQFLGSVPPEGHNCILPAICDLHHPPVPIALDALGFFDRAGVFFAQVALTPELLSLQRRVTAATFPCGFPPDTRPYRPHITLARSKGRAGARTLRALQSQLAARPYSLSAAFTAAEFVLYESIATPSGSLYEIRDRFPLS